MISDAVGLQRVSRIVGYKITKGNFQTVSPNLPQRIAVLGEANTANQSTLDTDPKQITSAQQAGELYGYGSPIYQMARILMPVFGGGVDGIPVIVYPQASSVGAVAKKIEISPVGTATDNATHTVVIAGRNGLDGSFYNIDIVAGDTIAIINGKITDAVNNILGAPVTAVNTTYTTELTTKWKGLTANDLEVRVDTNNNAAGITYTVTSLVSGSGSVSIANALSAFGNDWNTIVVNGYGTNSTIMSALEQFNGIPDPVNPTGRFVGIVMKPFIAITGTTAEDPSSVTDARLDDVTIALAPAPLSEGFHFEAAANMAVRFATITQNTPHLDVAGLSYPDMPTPTAIGAMSDYDNRDLFVKKGCSTVDLVGGKYVIQDFVTTYHPVGENPPQFRYCRNLMLDFNVRFSYYLLEQTYVVDHMIAANDDTVTAAKVIKPKQWLSILIDLATEFGKRGLIADVPFMQASIQVGLSETNPDRLETFFKYKRSGFARISATTAEAGFNFGTN